MALPTLSPDDVVHAADWSADLETRCGLRIHVRPAEPADKAALTAFFRGLDPDAMRFRFLTACRAVNPEQLRAMTELDHQKTENFLGFLSTDPNTIVATAMLAGDAVFDTAEVAIAIRDDLRGQGIGWVMLEHVARCAKSRGFRTLQSIESRENHAAIELEREMGFTVKPVPGDSTVVMVEAQLS